MRSDAHGIRPVALALLLAGAALCAHAQTPATPASSAESASREQVHQAVGRVRADPLLGGTETRKTWQFKKRESKPWLDGKDWDWGNWDGLANALRWLADAMKWIPRSLRVLMWALGVAVVVFVLLRLRRWVRVRGPAEPRARAAPPSHVQSLDIRPESLPEAIGAAAAALWRSGQQRAALSLLYRGALSRLVHTHALPIRAASTEGECVALASAQLDGPRAGFFARLVLVWQRAVYGAHMPEDGQALGLCDEFDQRLTAAAPRGAA
jgi:hypothetical protein